MGTLGTPGSIGNALSPRNCSPAMPLATAVFLLLATFLLTTTILPAATADLLAQAMPRATATILLVPSTSTIQLAAAYPTSGGDHTRGGSGSPCAADASGHGDDLICTVDDDDSTFAGDASGRGDDLTCTVDDDDPTVGGDPICGDGGTLALAMPRATVTILLVPSTTTILLSAAIKPAATTTMPSSASAVPAPTTAEQISLFGISKGTTVPLAGMAREAKTTGSPVPMNSFFLMMRAIRINECGKCSQWWRAHHVDHRQIV